MQKYFEDANEANVTAFRQWVSDMLAGEDVPVYRAGFDEDSFEVGGIGGIFTDDIDPLTWVYLATEPDLDRGVDGWATITLDDLDLSPEQRARTQALATDLYA